jgi:mono/diheme cytochrome c family protein
VPRNAVWILVLGVIVVATTGSAVGRAEPQAVAPAASPSARAFVDEYCVTCHNPRLKTGGLTLEGLDASHPAANAETWEKVVRKLQLRVMPPQGARRPDDATYERTIAAITAPLDTAPPFPGRPVLHRLNRAEYATAIRDLLGIQIDVAALLPPDDAAYGFDNVADALGSSPALLEAYLAASRKISALAVGDPRIGAGSETHTARQDLSQDHHLDGLPLGTIGGMAAEHTFPADGEYEFQVKLYRTNLNAIRGLQASHQIELTLDGDRILLSQVGGDDDLVALQKNPTTASDALEAGRLRVRHFVKAGQRQIASAFLDESSTRLETNRLQRFVRDFNPYDAEGAPHVMSITVSGPFDVTANGATRSAAWTPVSPRLFVCRPSAAAAETACARRVLSTLGRRAYRRPLSSSQLDALMSFYDRGRRGASFEAGVESALRFMLASPEFVFRAEPEPSGAAAGAAYRIGDFDLASRLSFFLWSSLPDDPLLDLAAKGTLHEPAVLSKQVARMLADDRADAFVGNFAGQWLQLRNLKSIVPNSDLFPDFDDNLRQAFRRESELFFASVMREDRNVLDLMTADYTFVNERLAKHYGIPNVVGDHFRRVQLTEPERFGLLGKGAVLLVTSHANTTSPVLRGKFVLDNVLGSAPPPPPPNVPALPEPDGVSTPKTMRQQMELHRGSPVCAGCHKTMDPIGFALERFDAVGTLRVADFNGTPLDTADVLADGTRVDGVVSLREALVRRPEIFVQTLTEKLMVYALGRGLTYQDMPTVRRIVSHAREHQYRFSALVDGIVTSAPFEWRLKAPATEQSPRTTATR